MLISEKSRVFLKSFPCSVHSGLLAWITGMSPAEMNHYHMAGVMGDSVVLPNSLLLHKRELVVTKCSAHTAHTERSCKVLKQNILIKHHMIFAQHCKNIYFVMELLGLYE